jgi:hypothetical protein
MQPPRISARPPGHPADRTPACDALDHLDAEPDMFALDLRRDRLVVQPAIAVADDLVSFLDKARVISGLRSTALATASRQTLTPDMRNSRQPPTREPYSNTDSTIRLHRPGKDGAAISVSTPSDIPSPSMIERSPPPSKFKLMLTAILAPPGHCGSGGLAP